MKKQFAIIVLVLLTISCSSSDSDTSSTSDTDNILLRKIISTSSSGTGGSNTYTNTYAYNGKKLVNVTSDDFEFRVFYTGNLITSIKDYFLGTLQGTSIYQYDSSNRLISWTEYVDAPETRINRQREFQYNSDGTITVNGQIFDTGENELSPIDTEKYFLNSNQEVERVEVFYPNGTQVANYTYDSKNHMFKNVTGFKAINLVSVAGFNSNITSITYSGYDAGYNDLFAQLRTYTYNADAFPIAGTRSYPNDPSMSVMTDQYIYE